MYEWPAIPLLIAMYIMKKQYFMKDRLGFIDKELYEITLEYYIIALRNIAVIFTWLSYNGIAEMKQYLFLVINIAQLVMRDTEMFSYINRQLQLF